MVDASSSSNPAQRKVCVVGTGKRVLSTALPAFAAHPEHFTIQSLFARRPKTVQAVGRDFEVLAFETIEARHLEGIDLLYLAVTKDAVPSVLRRLTDLGVGSIDLLIDTPVVRFKHFRHADQLRAFRHAWVAEDVAFLPWLDTLRLALTGGHFGELQSLHFERSAYAYHGVALAKALSGCDVVRHGKRSPSGEGLGSRRMLMDNGIRIEITEPRDYERGHILIRGSAGSISDSQDAGADQLLEALEEDGLIRAFRCGLAETQLSPAESALTAGDPEGSSVTFRMNAAKRVGFARLLQSIAAGQGGYDPVNAMDDMVVDYHLEKLKRYRANPFTSARSPLARTLLRTISRAGG